MVLTKNIQEVDLSQLHRQCEESSFGSQFFGFTQTEKGKIDVLLGDDFEKESELDQIISNHVPTDNTPEIYSIVDKLVQRKDFRTINYKNELENSNTLHPVETFFANGLIDSVVYYFGYQDANNQGKEILKVTHNWTVDESEPIPSARSILSRDKTWRWVQGNGEYNIDTKIKEKIYDTLKKRNEEGKRRRDNIFNLAQIDIEKILIVNNLAPNQSDAIDMMIDLFEEYAQRFNTWRNTGKGKIYTELVNDDKFDWFSSIIGEEAAMAIKLDSSWNDRKISEYAVDKLKGLI